MKSRTRPVIHLYLGRHETTASGLWVYGKTVFRVLLLFLEALKEGGLRTPLLRVTYGGGDEFEEELTGVFSEFPVDVELCRLPALFAGRRLSMIADIFCAGRGDALVHGTANLIPAAFSSKRVLTLHDILQAYSPAPAESLYVRMRRVFYRLMLRLQCRLAHVVVTDHETSREHLRNCLGCGDKIQIIYPPLDRVYMNAPLPSAGESSNVMLAFASSDPRKNLDNLLFAFSAWGDRGSWRLKIVSNAEEMTSHLDSLAVSLHIRDSVEFLSRIPQWEMPLVYESVDVLLFPSLGEGFGYPIYEALSQGVRVMCARGSVIEPLARLVGGSIVECDSLTGRGLVEGLVNIAALRPSAEEIMFAAQAVRAALSEDLMAREIVRLYRKLVPELFESRILKRTE